MRRLILTSAVLLSTLVASTVASVARSSGSTGADQISDLKAQAATISEQLVQQQLEVGAYEQQYSVASAKVASDESAVAQLDQQITQDQADIAQQTQAVRQAAIRTYTDYGSQGLGSDASLFSGNEEKVQAASEYSDIAAGNITMAVDGLRTAQGTLRADQAILQRQQEQDAADANSEASDLSHATATQNQMQQLQAQVTGQLAAAVAQQAAAQAAAAAAAVKAAQEAAAQKAAAEAAASTSTTAAAAPAAAATVSTDSAPASSSVPTDNIGTPDLPPFLQCVIQAESGGNYGAVSPNGEYMGAFQFSQATWNMAAQAAGLPNLVGVPPNEATPAEQDEVAIVLYQMDGEQPWLGDRCAS